MDASNIEELGSYPRPAVSLRHFGSSCCVSQTKTSFLPLGCPDSKVPMAHNPAQTALLRWMADCEETRHIRQDQDRIPHLGLKQPLTRCETPAWATEWAAELTAKFESELGKDETTVMQTLSLERVSANASSPQDQDRSRSPPKQERCHANPWANPRSEDLAVLRTDKDIMKALDCWCEQMVPITRAQKADLTIAFEPLPPIRSEAQLHHRVAAMGIAVYAKGSTPVECPFGIQGGQAGQYSVAITLCLDPVVKFTIQLQCVKGNVVVKGKRAVFEIPIMLKLFRFLGQPKGISVKMTEAKPKEKLTRNTNLLPLMPAAANDSEAHPGSILAAFSRLVKSDK